MSQRNKAILEQANAAVTRGDYDGFLSHCTDDVIWNFVGDQTLKGKEAVRRYMQDTYLEPPAFVVKELIAENDQVAALGTITLKDKGGSQVQYAYCDVWRLRDGKLAELTAYVIELTSER